MLAEIGQDRVAQAGCGAAVLLHRLQPLQIALVQQRSVLLLYIRVLPALKQEFVDDDILRREKQHTLGGQTVAPGAAGLLIVVLHAGGHVVV